MKIKPKDVLVNLPTVLLFKDDTGAASLASGFNTFIHGKVHMKYDVLGVLTEQTAVIFYLQRNDEFHSLRDQFMDLIEREELLRDQPSLQELQEEKDREDEKKWEIAASQLDPYSQNFYESPSEEDEMPINSPFLTKEAMLKLNTKRLLSYKKKLLSYHETPNWDNDGGIDKTSPEWQEAYANVKSILSSREHVEK